MSAASLLIEQRAVALGRRIGQGGEGEVFLLDGDTRYAVKLYKPAAPPERERKVAAMIRRGLAGQAPQVAFPLSIARTPSGKFAGFLMQHVADHEPLHELYSPAARRLNFPQADYRFLVRTALNIARATAQVHALGCVIGDVNHSSILISREATATLIDADSFQFNDQGELFRCTVGVAEYTPPELQGISLKTVTRTPNHDAFGLAVVIFQLLFMGRHPFIGRVVHGALPELASSIRELRFAYSHERDAGMERPPGAPTLRDFPGVVASAFERAFGREGRERRPDAAAWVAHLKELEQALIACPRNELHWYPRTASECLWCAMEQAVATTLFVPRIPTELVLAAFDPLDAVAGGFDLEAVWGEIEAFVAAQHLEELELTPPLDSLRGRRLRPSRAARRARWRVWARVMGGAGLVALAVGVPRLLWVWTAFGLYLLLARGRTTRKSLLAEYQQARRAFDMALEGWRHRAGIGELEKLLSVLRQAHLEYADLAQEERRQKEEHGKQRRGRQLLAFLEGFQIRRSGVTSIGPHRQATLAAYGIETAAAVTRARVMSVPGIGSVHCEGLLEWRRSLEARFVYDSKPNEQDRRELAGISAAIQSRAAALRRGLRAGRANLEGLLKSAQAMAVVPDPGLERLYGRLQQARVNLQHLGGQPDSYPG